MRIEFHYPAEEHERCAPHAFDRLIGQVCPFTFKETEDGPTIAHLGEGIVVDVKVDEDGRGATWTVEVSDTGSPDATAGLAGDHGMSFRVPEIPERWWE